MPTKRKSKRAASKSKHKVRASWKGMLRFGLVAFQVEAFNARRPEAGAVAFHQLHAECHNRIRYEKHCPVHGKVENNEIVSGYEYSRGRYVEVEAEELDALRTEHEKALTLDNFVEPEEIDPIYYDGRMYYLAPASAEAREPYAVFMAALEREGRYGVGQVVFSGKDQVVLLRPYNGALHMAMLNYPAEMRDAAEVVGTLPEIRGGDKQVRLAEQLIQSWGEEAFEYSDYTDPYLERVKELIDAKVEGRELVAPEEDEEPEVVNFMDALRKSMQRAPKTSRHAHGKNGHAGTRSRKRRRAS
jgi:DNA end-binding protein Ku